MADISKRSQNPEVRTQNMEIAFGPDKFLAVRSEATTTPF
jgi:hypothetical protein